MIQDELLSESSFKKLSLISKLDCFKDEVNPVDGVNYPLICKDIPKEIESEIIQGLGICMDRPVRNPMIFMRKSPKGIDCPHQVHSDCSMGKYSLMLYMNDGAGGTSFVKHKRSGITYSPEDSEFLDIIHKDQNNADAWEIIDYCPMRPNRAFIFDSRRLHRAEPIGGFGRGKDSRIVLTCFFS
jgi:hypothetical protein